MDRRTSENVGFEIPGLRGLSVFPFERACFFLPFNNSNIPRKLPDVCQQFNTEVSVRRSEF